MPLVLPMPELPYEIDGTSVRSVLDDVPSVRSVLA